MAVMLLGLAVLYWFLGDKTDAKVLFCAFIPVALVDVILELRAGRALRALKATLQSNAKVMRDGTIHDIPIRDLVPGDVILFEEGQTLPADGQTLEAEHLSLNEAALTGESIPVEKIKGQAFLSGTTVIAGRGLGIIEKTGMKTRFGAIANLLGDISQSKSPLRKKIDHFVRIIVILAFIIAVALFILELQSGKGVIQSLIIALTLAMSAVPEEFPLVFTMYLSLGAWRLSQKGVLVKSLPSVETLGSVDVIGTDKTGTLTEGLFQLEGIKQIDNVMDEQAIWKLALMACEPHPVDSLETAIFSKGKTYLPLLHGYQLVYDYPFEQPGKHMSHVWKNVSTGESVIAMKGAIEGVLEHCALSSEKRQQIEKMCAEIASQAKRILALAGGPVTSSGNRFQDEKDLTFLGFLVFADPIRSSAKLAIEHCQQSGIEIKMLTGDHLLTAHAVADALGIKHRHDCLFTGNDLARMSEEKRKEAYLRGVIFARVSPEQKYELVKVLKESGKVVAMTGDGINDAPALKLADIGISMGKNATDVARSAAQMVLLHNDFSGIVESVFEGRTISSNLRRSFGYLVSFHIPVILLALIPPFLQWPSLYLPVHIVVLQILVHPISAFAFENLQNPKGYNHKQADKSLLNTSHAIQAVVAGLLLSCGALLLFYSRMYLSIEEARALAFCSVLFGNLIFVFVESFPVLTRKFFITAFVLVALIFTSTMTPLLTKYLHLSQLGLSDLGIACGVGMAASVISFAKKIIDATRISGAIR